MQRHDPRDDGVGQFAHPPARPSTGGTFPVTDYARHIVMQGSRIRARHDAHGQGGLRRGEQPDGARRGLEAGPLRRGRLHVEYRRIQRNRQLGARHRGPHARGGRRIPHLCHPLLRHGDRIPPRRVVGDPHLPHRGVHAGGVRRTAARVPRHRAGAGTDGGRMPQRGAARGIAPVAHGVRKARNPRTEDTRTDQDLRGRATTEPSGPPTSGTS